MFYFIAITFLVCFSECAVIKRNEGTVHANQTFTNWADLTVYTEQCNSQIAAQGICNGECLEIPGSNVKYNYVGVYAGDVAENIVVNAFKGHGCQGTGRQIIELGHADHGGVCLPVDLDEFSVKCTQDS